MKARQIEDRRVLDRDPLAGEVVENCWGIGRAIADAEHSTTDRDRASDCVSGVVQ